MTPKMGVYTKADADADIAVHAALAITHGATDALADQADIAVHAADLDAHHEPPQYSGLVAGDYFFPLAWNPGSAGSRIAGQYYYIPIWLPVPMTFDRIGLNVATGASAGKKAIVGCYKHTNGFIGNLQFDAGEIAIDATALALASINQQLTAGYWWLVTNLSEACSVDQSASLNFPTLGTGVLAGAKCYLDAVAYPSPATLPTTPAVVQTDKSSYTPPWIYLRVKSIP